MTPPSTQNEPDTDTDPLTLLAGPGDDGRRPLLALDRQFASIRASTTEPLIGQMRLLWWHDALAALDTAPAPAVPILQDLQRHVLPRGVTGPRLAEWSELWEALIDPTIDEPERVAIVDRRGALLFDTLAVMHGATAPGIAVAGACWSLADAARWSDATPSQQDARGAAARARWRAALAEPWPRAARPFLLVAHAALTDTRGAAAALRTAGFMLTGRTALFGAR